MMNRDIPGILQVLNNMLLIKGICNFYNVLCLAGLDPLGISFMIHQTYQAVLSPLSTETNKLYGKQLMDNMYKTLVSKM